MKQYKAAVIGTGYIGVVHIEQLMRLPNVEVVGVVDKNTKLATELAEKYGIPKVYAGAEEALADAEVDVIHNCTPNNLHFEINKQAILAGKEVFSEKPLALSAAESGELVELAEEHNITTGINFCYRYYPVVQEAAARVARGDIGTVYNVMGNFLQDWLLYETDYSWRLDPKMAGASNIIGDLGSHWCDLAQFVTGMKITEVMADIRTTLPVRKRPKSGETLTFSLANDIEYEDVPVSLDEYGSMLIRFENGGRGTFTTSQLAAGRKCHIDMQVYGAEGSMAWTHERSAELWLGKRNEANQVFIESPILQIESTRGYAKLPSGHPMGYMDAVLNLFADYYRALDAKREGRESGLRFPDFKAGHAEMLVLEAAIESVKTKSWVEIRY
ncbi:MAG: Gfo/Idh/MocA family protein [Armatimonadota bacterium]